jgi:hypothetical protein
LEIGDQGNRNVGQGFSLGKDKVNEFNNLYWILQFSLFNRQSTTVNFKQGVFMRCSKAEKNLSAYLDRELNPRAAGKLETHLSGCPRCREKLAELERVEAALGAIPGREPSPFLWTRVKAGINSEAEPARSRPVFARFRLAPVPARVAIVSLFLAVVMGGVIFSLRRTAVNPEPAGVEIAVAENLDLLEDYELIKNLDFLENWEGGS